MADIMSKRARSELMAACRPKGNRSTEQVLVALFRSLGIVGWRRHARVRRGTPDFVFPRARVAVFADGCFWHGCPRHYTKPATRRGYWRNKVIDNRRRDKRVARELRRMGWSVWRIWECRIARRVLPRALLAKIR